MQTIWSEANVLTRRCYDLEVVDGVLIANLGGA